MQNLFLTFSRLHLILVMVLSTDDGSSNRYHAVNQRAVAISRAQTHLNLSQLGNFLHLEVTRPLRTLGSVLNFGLSVDFFQVVEIVIVFLLKIIN